MLSPRGVWANGPDDGLIVGSAIVRRIAVCGDRPREEVLRDVGDYAQSLLAALEA